ncbi:MAG: hypothetical protein M1831_003628 [Alyxoria varia]|nr:MAG: hypothetical protein M1831_003628 [Alyxoria varia]
MSDAFRSGPDPASANHNVATTNTLPSREQRREAKGSPLPQDPVLLQSNGSPHYGVKSAGGGGGHSHFDSIRKRLKRTRESGGFLLEKDAARISSAETRGERDNQNLDDRSKSKKIRGKRESAVNETKPRIRSSSVERVSEDTRSTDNQLPPTEVEQSPQNGKRMSHDAQITATRSSSSTLPSMDAALSTNTNTSRRVQDGHATTPSLDSAQIVRMALNLSESRRMNLEPGQLAAVSAPSGSRSTSAMLQPTDALLHGSLHHQSRERPASSTGGHVTSQSPSSRRSQTLSPSPRSSIRGSSTGLSDSQAEHLYHISPATLSRAEKAKNYFELAHQHRRLLEFLPPLRPDCLSHVHEPNNLGRPYNPLQFLRDRNIRGSHSVSEDPGWNDVGRVQNWVNLVEDESNSWDYQVDDVALLPPFGGASHEAATAEQGEGERARAGTVSLARKGQRVPFNWAVNPAGLLEDAYWLEQDDHKAKIENRDGSKPFRQVRRPARAGTGDEMKRSETISHKDRRSNTSDYHSSPTITKTATSVTSGGTEDEDSVGEAHSLPHTDTKKSRVKRRLLKRNRTRSDSSDDLGASDSHAHGKNFVHGHQHGTDVNIGPLERHMRYLLEQESAGQMEQPETSREVPASSEGQRRWGISERSHGPRTQNSSGHRSPRKTEKAISKAPLSSNSSVTDSRPSLDHHDRNAKSKRHKHTHSKTDPKSQGHKSGPTDGAKMNRRGFLRGHKNRNNLGTDVNDFAARQKDIVPEERPLSPLAFGRRLFDGPVSPASPTAETPWNEDQIHGGIDDTKTDQQVAPKRSSQGGQASDPARSEKTLASAIVFKRQPPRRGSSPSKATDASRAESGSTGGNTANPKAAVPSEEQRRRGRNEPDTGTRPQAGSMSHSKSPNRSPYHIQNLPLFVSSTQSSRRNDRSIETLSDDHISRQQAARRLQRKHSRFESLAPPALDTGEITHSSDVSPTNSSPILSRESTAESLAGKADSHHHGNNHQERSTNLEDASKLPRSARAARSASSQQDESKQTKISRPPEVHGLLNQERANTEDRVSFREIAQVRSLLLCPGVKAKSIVSLANTPRQSTSTMLRTAATISGQNLSSSSTVTRRQEHVVAAQTLSRHLTNATSSFRTLATRFQDETCRNANMRIDDLQNRARWGLMARAQDQGNQADAFVAQLTTAHTLKIKQVNDSVDEMMRKRWKHLRMVRRVGFATLEWVVVGLMWFIWLFVILFKLVKGVVVRFGRGPSDFNCLNIIHIAGTKGKGSTSAFISSILRQYSPPPGSSGSRAESTPKIPDHDKPQQPAQSQFTPKKIGLYTSPHLRSVRERIQINNQPLPEPLFARYFFEIWDRLEANYDPQRHTLTTPKPFYFRFLTLVALHAYLREGVDVAILECGVGGEHDSTNIVPQPCVTAVTSLGVDHTAVLGSTIEDIAWHKAGIFKQGTRVRTAFTSCDQPPAALEVLSHRASDEQGMQLAIVPRHPEIENGSVKLGLAGDFQHTNASLAIAVAAAFLREVGISRIPEPLSEHSLPAEFRKGLEEVMWGGRCEIRREANLKWHIDGAHTIESIKLIAEWFASSIREEASGLPTSDSITPFRKRDRDGNIIESSNAPLSPDSKPPTQPKRMLIFNQQTRDASTLAKALHTAFSSALQPIPSTTDNPKSSALYPEQTSASPPPLFTHAIFTTNVTYSAHTSTEASATKPKGSYKPDLLSINTNSSDVTLLTVQKELAEVWGKLDVGCTTEVASSIEEAVTRAREIAAEERSPSAHGEGEGEVSIEEKQAVAGSQDNSGDGESCATEAERIEPSLDGGAVSRVEHDARDVKVLVTGSLHLVGGLLEVLEPS